MILYIKAWFSYIYQDRYSQQPFSYYYSFHKAAKIARKRTKYLTNEYYETNLKLSDDYIPKFKNQDR